jgi:hypothetical protein
MSGEEIKPETGVQVDLFEKRLLFMIINLAKLSQQENSEILKDLEKMQMLEKALNLVFTDVEKLDITPESAEQKEGFIQDVLDKLLICEDLQNNALNILRGDLGKFDYKKTEKEENLYVKCNKNGEITYFGNGIKTSLFQIKESKYPILIENLYSSFGKFAIDGKVYLFLNPDANQEINDLNDKDNLANLFEFNRKYSEDKLQKNQNENKVILTISNGDYNSSKDNLHLQMVMVDILKLKPELQNLFVDEANNLSLDEATDLAEKYTKNGIPYHILSVTKKKWQ